jgi:hypothetical protein
MVLALTSVFFASVNLSDPKQALGLPDGSVRAVIALSLVVLFAILSVFLYSSLASSGQTLTTNQLNPTQFKAFQDSPAGKQILWVDQNGSPKSPTFVVHYRDAPDPTSQDFAKQLLVLIGTLMTSVAGFYFGAQTATSAASAASDSGKLGTLVIRSIDHTTLTRGSDPIQVKISGENLDLVNEVKIVSGSQTTFATDVSSNATQVTCSLAVKDASPTGAWDVIVTDKRGQTAKLQGAVTVS